MKYKKEDWVVGRMYTFISREGNDYTCEFFTPGKSYKMVSKVDWYDGTRLLPDAEFIGDDGEGNWACLLSFVPVEQS